MTKFQSIPVDSILIGTRFRKDCGSMDSLINSISKFGLLQPIVVRPEVGEKFTLLAGFRRLNACKMLKMDMIEAHVMGVDENE
jgi:ParB family transcriptional regulator, chromosome partitioning protein